MKAVTVADLVAGGVASVHLDSLPPCPRRFVRMFKPRFAPLVKSGRKRQTVRPSPARMPRRGDLISLRMWAGRPYASRHVVLREAEIVDVQPVCIEDVGVLVGGRGVDAESFAKADGFDCFAEMLDWFRAEHRADGFQGIVIFW